MNEGNPSSRHDSWLPGVTALLAFLSCNGTIVLVGLFSLFGITLVVNPHVQAAVISIFAVLTAILVILGRKKHGKPGPLYVALVGAVLVVGTMYISFNKAVETAGLLALVASAIWNWRLNRCAGDDAT